MLHPVGPLPAAVYWRRRLLVLGCAVGVLGGGGWVAVAAATSEDAEVAAEAPGSGEPVDPPLLDRVSPSLAAVEVPTASPTAPPTATAPAASSPPPEPTGPAPGDRCSDEMIAVEVQPRPATTPVGSKPTFDLVVSNVSAVPCVRTLDKQLQEIVLLDGAGNRLWGSNDCFPEATSDVRTLQPEESVVFPVLWGGLTSTPGCATERTPPPPGDYVLRGRLDTRTSPDAQFTLT
ncbi:MucR family transcriptional regulator [Modestobacter sp. SYSU DS0511]